LIRIENEIYELRDPENLLLPELVPFGQLNVPFEVALLNPELVSRRYPLNFKGEKILDAAAFIGGWRRHFTYYIDYTRRLKEFAKLNFKDQVCLAKRRLVNMGWWTHMYLSLLCGKDGICMAGGHFHPYKTDPQFPDIDPVMSEFAEAMMPISIEDILFPLRRMNIDFTEYVLLKFVILFRDEFFLSEEGLRTVREASNKYCKILFNYILHKCDGDSLDAINRYTELLGFIPSILILSSKFNERIQVTAFFNIIDLDPMMQDIHATTSTYLNT
jgi:hypothetical protein